MIRGIAVVVHRDAAHAAAEVADAILATVRREASTAVLLAGGATPRAAYQCLAARSTATDFARCRLLFGDERVVPRDAPDSNYAMARAAWFDPVGLADDRVARIPVELGAEAAARAAEASLRAACPLVGPDLVLLGLGIDGHTCSLFPGETVPGGVLYAATRGGSRVSATPALLATCRRSIFLATGATKAAAVRELVAGSPGSVAATIAACAGGTVELWVDPAAAAGL